VEVPARLLIPDLGVDTPVEEGQTLRITFTPPRAGQFVFEVHVEGYRVPGYLVVRQPEGGLGPGDGDVEDDEDGGGTGGDGGEAGGDRSGPGGGDDEEDDD